MSGSTEACAAHFLVTPATHWLPSCLTSVCAGAMRHRLRTCSGAPPRRRCLPLPRWTRPSAFGTRGSRCGALRGSGCATLHGCWSRELPMRLPSASLHGASVPAAQPAGWITGCPSHSITLQSKSMLSVAAHDADVNVISWNRATSYMLASGEQGSAVLLCCCAQTAAARALLRSTCCFHAQSGPAIDPPSQPSWYLQAATTARCACGTCATSQTAPLWPTSPTTGGCCVGCMAAPTGLHLLLAHALLQFLGMSTAPLLYQQVPRR